jgi:hypothetical protein
MDETSVFEKDKQILDEMVEEIKQDHCGSAPSYFRCITPPPKDN